MLIGAHSGSAVGLWESLSVGGVQWDSVHRINNRFILTVISNYTLFPLKKLVLKKLKSFP